MAGEYISCRIWKIFLNKGICKEESAYLLLHYIYHDAINSRQEVENNFTYPRIRILSKMDETESGEDWKYFGWENQRSSINFLLVFVVFCTCPQWGLGSQNRRLFLERTSRPINNFLKACWRMCHGLMKLNFSFWTLISKVRFSTSIVYIQVSLFYIVCPFLQLK